MFTCLRTQRISTATMIGDSFVAPVRYCARSKHVFTVLAYKLGRMEDCFPYLYRMQGTVDHPRDSNFSM